MSDTGGTCAYQARKEEPETWHGDDPDGWFLPSEMETEDGIWDCPHEALDGHDRCVFHLPPEDVPDDVDESGHFVRAINEESVAADGEYARRKREFVGATFDELHVDDTLVAGDGHPIVLAHAGIKGDMDLVDARIEPQLYAPNSSYVIVYFSRATFQNGAYFGNTTFNNEAYINDATFNGEISFENATFNSEAIFMTATFDRAYFSDAVFNDEGDFRGASFNQAYFSRAMFGNEGRFQTVTFDGKTSFSDSIFNDRGNFRNAAFDGEADFSDATFRDEANFFDVIFNGGNFRHAIFKAEANFENTIFSAETDFKNVIFKDEITFHDATFKLVDFRDATVDAELDFFQADLTEGNFAKTPLTNAKLENTLLNRATLTGADLRGAALAGAVLGDARIDSNTRFLGTPDQENESTPEQENDSADAELSSVSGYCIYDPRYTPESSNDNGADSDTDATTASTNPDEDLDSAQSTYRAIETLAGANARPRLQSQCFINRQDIQCKQYWRAMKSATSFWRKIRYGGRWLRARVSRGIFLYGESPWRVTAWSFASILVFALLYPLGGWVYNTEGEIVTYASGPFLSVLGNSFYFSTVTFTSLGYGDFQPYGFGRSLATIETALGAILIALLVFVLGRRAAR